MDEVGEKPDWNEPSISLGCRKPVPGLNTFCQLLARAANVCAAELSPSAEASWEIELSAASYSSWVETAP